MDGGRVQGSAGFALVVLDDRREELDDLFLLAAWEFCDLIEQLSDLSDRAGSAKRFALLSEEVLDGHVQGSSELWDGVGTGRFVALFPESDVLLGLADELSKLSLGQTGIASQCGKAGSLCGSWFRKRARHAASVGVDFWIVGLRCHLALD